MPDRRGKSDMLVIADDFTGANDAGVGLSRYGARVNVLFGGKPLGIDPQIDAWVVSTDSRGLPPEQAAARVVHVMEQWRALTPGGWIYKKIDSTLRGNLGAEIEAALLTSGAPLAIIAAATPSMGRFISHGDCYVHGVELIHTEFASDPLTPINTSSIVRRIKAQSLLPLSLVDVATVRGDGLTGKLMDLAQQGCRLVVLDSERTEDLQHIVAALPRLPFRPLLVGSAGLIDALAQNQLFQPINPLLAIVGSMSEMAQRQIAHALTHPRITLVDIDVPRIFAPDQTSAITLWTEQITGALRAGRHCVVRTCQDALQRQRVENFCLQHAIGRQRLGEEICRVLGLLARRVIAQQSVGGLYLTGGDVAIAVAEALGATGFQLRGQIAACVPYGRLLNSAAGTMPVMTKAGGFGSETTLSEVIRFIEEMLRD